MSRLAVDMARCLDPVQFARSVGFEPYQWQKDVLRSDYQRLLLNCHRQAGKTDICGLKGAHVSIYEPGSSILGISRTERQAKELFKKFLTHVEAVDRPVAIDAQNATTAVLGNGSTFTSLPGTGDTIRGHSNVRLLLIDEAARVPDETVAACRPMLAVSGGQMIAMSTPAGRRGWWYDAWENGGNAYERYMVKAEDCPRISAEFLEAERAALGQWAYASEYECSFESNSSSVFTPDDLDNLIHPEVEQW